MALKLDYIGKTFENPEGSSNILNGITFSLNKGEIIGIRGENGSGKSTLFNIISKWGKEWGKGSHLKS